MTDHERKYRPHPFQPNKIPDKLFYELDQIIYEKAYLCYHNDKGCNYVLNVIVDLLHQYKITESENR